LCLEGLAGVALLGDDPQRCAALLGGAYRLREERALPPEAVAEMVGAFRAWNAGSLDDRLEAERIENAGRDRLETELFEAAYTVGWGAAVDDLIGGGRLAVEPSAAQMSDHAVQRVRRRGQDEGDGRFQKGRER
jgi:hypothetical protein